jgi:hypothetical protein
MTINIYTSGAYDYINAKSDQLKEYARLLGISSTAIAGAIAKENNDYTKAKVDDRALDAYAGVSSYLGETQLLAAAKVALDFGLDQKLSTTFEQVLYKFTYPVIADVGPANIKVTTAFTLLDSYLTKIGNGNDFLDLRKYANDHGQLMRQNQRGQPRIFLTPLKLNHATSPTH